MGWWIGALVGGLAGAYGNKRKKDAQKSASARQRGAIAEARKMTPEEGQYLNRLQDRAKTGDPNIGKMRNMIYSPIQQNAQFQHQQSQALAIRSGLENSIVADELRRRVNQETLNKISEESEKLAMYNASYRERMEDRIDDFGLRRSQMLRDLALKEGGIASNSEINAMGDASLFGDITSGMSSAVSTGQDFGWFGGSGTDVTED